MHLQAQTEYFIISRSAVISGNVLDRDQEETGSRLTGVTVLCSWATHINPSLVLVQPRKTRP